MKSLQPPPALAKFRDGFAVEVPGGRFDEQSGPFHSMRKLSFRIIRREIDNCDYNLSQLIMEISKYAN
jgi:hypothetical protein